ncbi:MAG: AGE family epimerase/isomerase [Clostridia bacterium]|nr:AGE family epimerase/isomerase [Clostridia bacterium]
MNFKKYLTDNVLAFWLKNAFDDEFGGIFTQIDREGKVYGTEKSGWFQGRALWTFSKAYNCVEKREEYLKAAEKLFNFLPKVEDTDGRMFFTVTREGNPIQKRRYYFSETFACIGCAEYYKATRDPKVWASAEKYFDIAWKCYNHPELNPPKFYTSGISHSPIMIMMSVARTMASCGQNSEKYSKIARDLADTLITCGLLCEDVHALLENVSADGKFMDTPTGRLVNPGHGLETAWFLIGEGLMDKNEDALNAAKKIIDWTMPLGLDKKHGGIISFTDVLGNPPTALEWDMKLWWPQNEAIIANRMAYEVFGDKKYLESYEQLLDYAFTSFADKEYGEWYGYLHYDNTPANYLKGNIFKGPFHLPRMLIILHQIEEKKDICDFWK